MEQKRLKTAIIGVGRWGKNVAREFDAASELVYFASKTSDPALPHARRATVEEICADQAIEAVAIATPVPTHAEIVRKALEAGKHVFCEKPLTETSAEAHALAQLAAEKNRILMTGYVFLYHPVYDQLKILVRDKAIKRVECVWRKYGAFTDSIENALLTHHLSIAYDLLGMPDAGSLLYREGSPRSGDHIEIRLEYPSCQFVSEIDRLSQEKTHTIAVTLEDGKILTWDDTQLRRGEELLFEGAGTSLAQEIKVFLEAAGGGMAPRTGGDFGARVLEIHEMLKNSRS
ncbi:hypothetical protein A3D71_00530 [Candidatus Kaiserbacteria bacterium RIFCSPHIGHO2_02_FULL_55_20]|uniref:Gfo/Idh/MocA-like oxidoreductase N-terminal domain-containing protein n=1 Tax=Candidatus Kaiserbacteria bacterium RIFCSPHIGHO2_02_FULL_55_20 TaxID=1798497 RepID=A0A1F6DYN2_9BACT|nr:MAG: hypothetical protein A2680_01545 [Candidatus Kaiserbacteria bacterium RIFCSPHIGHO2_01_FULL_55_37]OGG66521.1 MAG: hypothetical protein A3D71_00530 [Candidatus Kaiserbacteria bacterium RIFCSPHIGHO2_02_FULL_55_20]